MSGIQDAFEDEGFQIQTIGKKDFVEESSTAKKKKGKKGLFIGGIVLAVLGVLGLLSSFGGIFASFPWLTVGIPAITSFYFDWFSGCIQAFIFCTLTTIFIKQAAG